MISRPTIYNLKPLQIVAINLVEKSRYLQSEPIMFAVRYRLYQWRFKRISKILQRIAYLCRFRAIYAATPSTFMAGKLF